jgi:hypothetical protein
MASEEDDYYFRLPPVFHVAPFTGDPYDVGRFLNDLDEHFSNNPDFYDSNTVKIQAAAEGCDEICKEWVTMWCGKSLINCGAVYYSEFKRAFHYKFCNFPSPGKYFDFSSHLLKCSQIHAKDQSPSVNHLCDLYQMACASGGIPLDHSTCFFAQGLPSDVAMKTIQVLEKRHWDPRKYKDVREAALLAEKELMREEEAHQNRDQNLNMFESALMTSNNCRANHYKGGEKVTRGAPQRACYQSPHSAD